jgi:hypothetical protein
VCTLLAVFVWRTGDVCFGEWRVPKRPLRRWEVFVDTDAGGEEGAEVVVFCWWVESWWPKRGILDVDMIENCKWLYK